MTLEGTSRPIAVYVHWPFCESKCPYCDFNSHVREAIDADAFRTAYLRELDHFAGLMPPTACASIFFGGGTPSLMPPAVVAEIITRIRTLWPSDQVPEVTLEANPSSVEAGRFRDYRAAGVNRISIGIQSLDDESLRFLGRRHNAAEARQAMELALGLFPRVNFDFIYARPGQAEKAWERELSEALAFGAGHMSLYQLTIEPGTAFFTAQRLGKLVVPDETAALALFDLTQEVTEKAGLPAYEVSNHARAGEECRHNMTYWNGGAYLGVGPGAHGRLPDKDGGTWFASTLARSPEAWLRAVAARDWGAGEIVPLSSRDRAIEVLMMGLRLNDGIDKARFARNAGTPIEQILLPDATSRAEAADLLRNDPGHIALTPKGLRVLDRLLVEIVA